MQKLLDENYHEVLDLIQKLSDDQLVDLSFQIFVEQNERYHRDAAADAATMQGDMFENYSDIRGG